MRGLPLSDLKTGESGYIHKVAGHGAFRHRIMEMGFVKGKKVTVIKNAPLKDPIEFDLLGYHVSLRRREASMIEVLHHRAEKGKEENQAGSIHYNSMAEASPLKEKEIQVALVGNPNAGKTSIFNQASHSREKVGNYGGVTVASKTATLKLNGYTLHITDLPGTYSLSCYSPEELFVRDYLLEQKPDVVINILDASNLERNLYLTTQLIEMDLKVVAGLNMYDELLKSGDKLEYEVLGIMLGIPFVPTVGTKGIGIPELLKKVIDVHEGRDPSVRNVIIQYGVEIERSVSAVEQQLKPLAARREITIPTRLLALRLLERDLHIRNFILHLPASRLILDRVRKERDRIEKLYEEPAETLFTDGRYGFIAGALKETYKATDLARRKTTRILDSFLTHKVIGFPLFAFFLWLMFTCTFSFGKIPVGWIENGVLALGNLIGKNMAEGSLKGLLIDGIVGGVGGVIIFLPNILILFLFISVMEDTGYLARAAFIMDRVMHMMGLHGKSFIPLIMAFGCNVPAIMATRTIESKNNRILTMLINPFMSCSARLPVYILLIGAVFPSRSGTILFILYFTGILVAVISAILFKKLIFKAENVPFVMELPPYRMPTLRSTIKHMWDKASQYLRKMGGLIMVASVLIWALGYYPRQVQYETDYEGEREQILRYFTGEKSNPLLASGQIAQIDAKQQQAIQQIENRQEMERQRKSYIGQIGHWIQPFIEPLGFDWKMGVSLISGIAAKEIVVSTMGVIYRSEDMDDPEQPLTARIRNSVHTDGPHKGKPVFTPVSAFSFLLFTLLYFPCIATIAAIKKESGTWKWALFSVVYTTLTAWFVSFVFYQTANLF
jgi:ferrous iron transport protein B